MDSSMYYFADPSERWVIGSELAEWERWLDEQEAKAEDKPQHEPDPNYEDDF